MLDLRNRLERIFLKTMVKQLREGKLTIEQSKSLAKEFLVIEPFSSVDDAKSKMESFSQKYPDFAILKEYMDSYSKEQDVENVVDQMRGHIKNNNIDAAIDAAKTITNGS